MLVYTVIVQLRAFHFLSFGQDVTSKLEPTDDNKGLGVFPLWMWCAKSTPCQC